MRALRGQTVLEFMIFISIVTVALFYMGPAIKRGLQSLIKVSADQIGNQELADQDVDKPLGSITIPRDANELNSEETHEAYSGYLVESHTEQESRVERKVNAFEYATNTEFNDRTTMTSNSVTDLGFTKQR